MDWTQIRVNQAQSPQAYAVLKDSTDWGRSANETGMDATKAIEKLHELLNRSLVALAAVEQEVTYLRAKVQTLTDTSYDPGSTMPNLD